MNSPMEFDIFKKNPCKQVKCLHCRETVDFYHYSGMGDLAPHFYCDTCSNILFRESYRQEIRDNEITEELLEKISMELPKCLCGGQFRVDSNPMCPHCGKEIAHQKNPLTRLKDPFAIQIKGALLLKPKK